MTTTVTLLRNVGHGGHGRGPRVWHLVWAIWANGPTPPITPPGLYFWPVLAETIQATYRPPQTGHRGAASETGADGPTARALPRAAVGRARAAVSLPTKAWRSITVTDFLTLEADGPEPWHTAAYTSYLDSEAWAEMRERIMRRARRRCETCGDLATQVHHLTYERLGHEDPADLLAVCEPCHRRHDAAYRARIEQQRVQRRQQYAEQQAEYEERRRHWEAEAKARQAQRLREIELNRWARQRYGTSWALWADRRKVEREFDAWLERMKETQAAMGGPASVDGGV